MAVYTWEGRTRQGTTKKGVMEAVGEAAVMAQLRAQMITPIAVVEKPSFVARTPSRLDCRPAPSMSTPMPRSSGQAVAFAVWFMAEGNFRIGAEYSAAGVRGCALSMTARVE